MGNINTNIRIDELIAKYNAEITNLKSEIAKLKTQNKGAIKLTLHDTGTLTSTEFENITSYINNGRNFILYGEMVNEVYGVKETFRFGSFEKLWDPTGEEYYYVCYTYGKMLVINNDRTYEFAED